MVVKVKRVYEPVEAGDGKRVLVDRLWPRGLGAKRAKIDLWLREVAPSDGLRRWFRHDPRKWDEFKQKYSLELRSPMKLKILKQLAEEQKSSVITLLYAARDREYNNAVALKEIVENLRS